MAFTFAMAVLAGMLPREVRAQQTGELYQDGILASSSLALLDGLSNSRTIAGNHVTILDHGPSAFQQWRRMLSSAEKSIYLQTYYLEDEGMCANLVDILKEKAGRGVKVAVIITRYSQLGKAPLTYLELKRAGIDMLMVGNIGFPTEMQQWRNSWSDRMREDERIFRSLPREAPFRQWFEEEDKDAQFMVDFALHEKMLIVDGTAAIIGGRNLSDSYFFWWQDLDVLLEGPIVSEVCRAFERNWQDFGGQALPERNPAPSPYADGLSARLTHSRPWLGAYQNLEALCAAMDMARDRIFISSQYLALPPKISQSLGAAAKRGVDVRILTNSLQTGREINLALGHFISLNYYDDLLRSGVKIYEYQSPRGIKLKPYYHTKQFIFDGKYLVVGSFNLSIRSSYLESEITIALPDPGLAGIQEGKFLADLESKARRITAEDLVENEREHGFFMDVARRLEILY